MSKHPVDAMSEEPTPSPSSTLPAVRSAQVSEHLRSYVLMECRSMIRYVWANGIPLPQDLQQSFDQLDPPHPSTTVQPLSSLSELHSGLARAIAPATPRTIHLLETDPYSGTLLGILGPLPNIRRLMCAALCFITLFIGFAQSEDINKENLQKLFSDLSGSTLLVILGFYMSAAGLGACFNSLFMAYSYVSQRTYDPRYDSSYWIRLALGVIAGLMLAQLIPIEGSDLSKSGADLTKPLLALLGGFSASLVYTILDRLVDTLESLFRNGPKKIAAVTAVAREEPSRGKPPARARPPATAPAAGPEAAGSAPPPEPKPLGGQAASLPLSCPPE